MSNFFQSFFENALEKSPCVCFAFFVDFLSVQELCYRCAPAV